MCRLGMNLYINGSLCITGTAAGICNSILSACTFSIGAGGAGSRDLHTGEIDDVRVYSRELTATEVQILFERR